jgi:oligopeptide transport system permease protein
MTRSLDSKSIEHPGFWLAAWIRFRHNRMAIIGLYLVIFLVTLAIIGPWISPYDYDGTDLQSVSLPPCLRHPMGTDVLGRDLLTRLLFGGRISLAVGICATLVSLLIGVTYGSVAGFARQRTNDLMMRLVDILYAIPFSIFVIVLMVVFGRNFMLLFLAIGAVEWLTMARIVRGQTISLRRKEFVEAARASGAKPLEIVFRHIVPNVLGPVVVFATLNIPVIILAESFLSFIGLGVQEPLTSLGRLISDGSRQMIQAPWMLVAPAVTMLVTLLALNFLGDGLRDALDPKER